MNHESSLQCSQKSATDDTIIFKISFQTWSAMWYLWRTKWNWGLYEYFDFTCQFSLHQLLHIH
jgi:hypothetical protein